MAAIVLALGALSLLLLVWTDHVAIRQRSHFALANGLMDLQIATSTAHLWLEEAITGKESARIADARSNLQEDFGCPAFFVTAARPNTADCLSCRQASGAR
jgi:hypothetical protein